MQNEKRKRKDVKDTLKHNTTCVFVWICRTPHVKKKKRERQNTSVEVERGRRRGRKKGSEKVCVCCSHLRKKNNNNKSTRGCAPIHSVTIRKEKAQEMSFSRDVRRCLTAIPHIYGRFFLLSSSNEQSCGDKVPSIEQHLFLFVAVSSLFSIRSAAVQTSQKRQLTVELSPISQKRRSKVSPRTAQGKPENLAATLGAGKPHSKRFF